MPHLVSLWFPVIRERAACDIRKVFFFSAIRDCFLFLPSALSPLQQWPQSWHLECHPYSPEPAGQGESVQWILQLLSMSTGQCHRLYSWNLTHAGTPLLHIFLLLFWLIPVVFLEKWTIYGYMTLKCEADILAPQLNNFKVKSHRNAQMLLWPPEGNCIVPGWW